MAGSAKRPPRNDRGTPAPQSGAKKTRQRADLEVVIAARGLALDGFTPTQIWRQMEHNPALMKDHRRPSLRTIQRILAKPKDATGSWSLADADPDDAALVLDVLAAAVDYPKYWGLISKDLAAWIVKIRIAAADMPPLWVLNVAEVYRAAVAGKKKGAKQLADLDQMLAFAPWRSERHYHRYVIALHALHPDLFTRFEVVDGRPAFSMPYGPGTEALVIASIGQSLREEISHD